MQPTTLADSDHRCAYDGHMTSPSGDRSTYFPAIEAKYGQPMSYWFGLIQERADQKYPVQIAFLRQEHGFSQAHANALVMYCRGSTSSKRFGSIDDYLGRVDPVAAATVRAIFTSITDVHTDLEIVMAWNQPMLRRGTDYVFGLSVQSRHLLLAPWGGQTLAIVAPKLAGYTVNKKTVPVPLDWHVDTDLVLAMVEARLAELAG